MFKLDHAAPGHWATRGCNDENSTTVVTRHKVHKCQPGCSVNGAGGYKM